MKIEYKTEGKVILKCDLNRASTVGVAWQKDGQVVKLMSGSDTICLSKSQLLNLLLVGAAIAADLEGEKNVDGVITNWPTIKGQKP